MVDSLKLFLLCALFVMGLLLSSSLPRWKKFEKIPTGFTGLGFCQFAYDMTLASHKIFNHCKKFIKDIRICSNDLLSEKIIVAS